MSDVSAVSASDEPASHDPPNARLILASASPRRELLLREAGYVFDVDPADADEETYPSDISPAGLAMLLAGRKADMVAARHPRDVVLAADTVVAAANRILGKPIDAQHAREMLALLGGTTHQVITAVMIARDQPARIRRQACVTSTVQMRPLSKLEVEEYVATDGWRGKAGGYGIQDRDPFVTRMSGSLTNIVGLPMDETAALLGSVGVLSPGV